MCRQPLVLSLVLLLLGGCDDGDLSTRDASILDGSLPDDSSGADRPDTEMPDGQTPDGAVCPGSSCDDSSSDWWPDRASDEQGSHHTPTGSQIRDLHSEHVTPYGGWFRYTAIEDPEYRWDTLICWSESETELDSAAGMDDAHDRGDCQEQDVRAHTGFPIERPMILTSLTPATIYFVRVGVLLWSGTVEGQHLSNVVRIETRADPRRTLPSAHPRVAATPSMLADLRGRMATDARTQAWASRIENETLRAASDRSYYEPGRFGPSAALLWHATGERRFLDAALALLQESLLPTYEAGDLVNNQYRWAGQELASTADLIWDTLTTPLKQRIVDAMLRVDEQDENDNPRLDDTDQYVANTHIQIAHALAVLDSPELSPESLERMDVVFDHALRRWYGVLQVKMRRARRVYGLSGGTMDDGTDYARGTQAHWLQSLWALDNVGMSQAAYAEWVWNNVRTHNLYSVVPGGSGSVTFGDIEDDGLQADGTHEIDSAWTSAALKLGLLDRWERPEQAARVRQVLADRAVMDRQLNDWAFLCDHDGIADASRDSLPTVFLASGFGQLFDRTGWGPDDSFFYFTAGWRAVDHNQPDVGHFSLWSGGRWLTHEVPAYDLDARKHNILLAGDAGQYALESQGSAQIVTHRSTDGYLYVLADTTAAYMNVSTRDFMFEHVFRAILWDKATDRVLIYDRMLAPASPAVSVEQRVHETSSVVLLDTRTDAAIELLMLVGGGGELDDQGDGIGIFGLPRFNRQTGALLTGR